MTIRFEDVRAVGFFQFVAGWIVVYFANSGIITCSLMIILGADILIAGLLTRISGRANNSRMVNDEQKTSTIPYR